MSRSRRNLLRLGAGALALGGAGTAGAEPQPAPPSRYTAASRAQLAAIAPAAALDASLLEGLRQGVFRARRLADLAAYERACAMADQAGRQGLYVQSTADPTYVWERIGPLCIDHFGADPAAADNASAIQAALDLLKPEWSGWANEHAPIQEPARALHVPPRTYHLKAGLTLWSKQALLGADRTQSCLVLDTDAADDVLIALGGSRRQPHIGQMHRLADLGLVCAHPGAAAISAARQVVADKGFLVNWLIERINVHAGHGLILDAYCQQTVTRDIFFGGRPERLVKIAGARNLLHDLNKEGQTGEASAAPYVLIGTEDGSVASANNVLDNLLVEQRCHRAKSLVRIAHSNNDRIFDVHLEPGGDDYDAMLSLHKASGVRLGKLDLATAKTRGVIKLSGGSSATIDRVQRPPGLDWRTFFALDEGSRVVIDELETYTGSQLDAVDGGPIEVRRVVRKTAVEVPSQIVTTGPAANLVVNPDFSAGLHGWSTDRLAGATLTLIPSRVVPHGQGLRLAWPRDVDGSFSLTQHVAPLPQADGLPLVMTLIGEITSPTGTGFERSYLQADLGSRLAHDGRIQGPGLVTASTVVAPRQEAGAMRVSVIIANPRAGWTFDVHFVALSPGRTVLPLANVFGSLRVMGAADADGRPSGGFVVTGGAGAPEGVLAAPLGSLYVRTDVGRLYVKETGGAGSTGWVAK